MKTVQRSPDLGLRIRLQPLAPVVQPVVVDPPVTPPTGTLIACIGYSNIGVSDSEWVFTVTISQTFTVDKTYVLTMEDGTLLGALDYDATADNATFSEGVSCTLGVMAVPAGVFQFTITVAKIEPYTDNPGYYRVVISEGDLYITAYGFGTLVSAG